MATGQASTVTSTVHRTRRRLKPCKDDPAATKAFIRALFKLKPANLDIAAAQLGPIYGLGDDSAHDPAVRIKAQSIFVSPSIEEPFAEFADLYLQGRWGLALASWNATMDRVRAHDGGGSVWASKAIPSTMHWDVNDFYARFLIRVMHDVKHPTKLTHLLTWIIRDAESDEDTYWILFHALMYLQLETMWFYRHRAPMGDFVNHCVSQLKGDGPLLFRVRNFISSLGSGR